jgi:uncharacterized OB-fold protein
MTEITELPAFPAVGRDSGSAAFFDAAARGELLVQQCGTCATVLPPEAKTCVSCGSAELGPTVVSGLGSLVSWVVVRQAPIPVLAGAVPYVTAVVELDEGPWLMVRLVGDVDGIGAGDRVQVDFVRSGAGETTGEMLPVFRRLLDARTDGSSEEQA